MLTNITLSTKERYLLEDAKGHEEQCILKYQNYGKLASSLELKNVFQTIEQSEQTHLNSINQLLNGTVPQMGGGQQSQQSQGTSSSSSQSSGSNTQSSGSSSAQSSSTQSSSAQSSSAQSSSALNSSSSQSQSSTTFQATDKDLCADALSIEKYVSSLYNTAIFEFKNKEVRQVLNHIQKEEQEHGEKIFQYMSNHGMYDVSN